jgi:hypothetical protein
MAAPEEKQAMDIATATALQNFMSDLQTRKVTGFVDKSTETSDRTKPKPALVVLLPSDHQRQVMRASKVIPVPDDCTQSH